MLLMIVFLSALGCKNRVAQSSTQSTEEKTPIIHDLDQIRKDGKLVVLMGNSSSSYFIYRGRPLGFEYELLDLFAKDLGLKLEVKIVEDLNDIFDRMNSGEGDLIAAGLTITKERSKIVTFSDNLMTTRQVLIQKKGGKDFIRSQLNLIGKKVFVRRNSSYYSRLQNLSDEIGGEIDIEIVAGDIETEELIKKVATNEIKYTIADEHIALINKTYFPSIDASLPISFPQQLAWAAKKNAPELVERLNEWIAKMKKHSDFHHLKKKYYRNNKGYMQRSSSGYHSQFGGQLSPYDDLFKTACENSGWDWRFLASLAYQESKFDHSLTSWAGAKGLMQLMPETAKRFGGDSVMTVEKSIEVGLDYLLYLDKFWAQEILDSSQRMSYVLASYNAGLGHVQDALRLSEKYGNKTTEWTIVSYFLKHKSQMKYYTDAVVRHGYCRGSEPVNYVSSIMNRYEQYKKLIDKEED